MPYEDVLMSWDKSKAKLEMSLTLPVESELRGDGDERRGEWFSQSIQERWPSFSDKRRTYYV